MVHEIGAPCSTTQMPEYTTSVWLRWHHVAGMPWNAIPGTIDKHRITCRKLQTLPCWCYSGVRLFVSAMGHLVGLKQRRSLSFELVME